MAQFDLKKATVKFKDGSTNQLTIKVAEGTINYSEKKNFRYVKDRGALSTVVEGDQEPVDVKLDIIWEFLKQGSGEPVTPEDFLKKRGGAAGYTSADSDLCAPYAIDIEIVYTPGCGGAQVETITISDFRFENLEHDFKQGILSVSGKANVIEPTVVRS